MIALSSVNVGDTVYVYTWGSKLQYLPVKVFKVGQKYIQVEYSPVLYDRETGIPNNDFEKSSRILTEYQYNKILEAREAEKQLAEYGITLNYKVQDQALAIKNALKKLMK